MLAPFSYSHFQIEYERLAQACTQFTSDVLDLCRDSNDVKAILFSAQDGEEFLGTISYAIRFEEKAVNMGLNRLVSVRPSVRHF